MAKCEKRELKPEPPPVEFVLTLSAAEVDALIPLLRGEGWPTQSGAGHRLNAILEVVGEARRS